jgi:AcrR family transcriptional regulator
MAAAQQGLRERKNERTRAAITRAALELALEVGFERATVAQIAERADVSPRTVHTWFPSKEDIVVGAADLPLDRLGAALASEEGDTLDRIQRWIRMEEELNADPDDIRRLRHRLLITDPHLRSAQRARQQAAETLIAAAIADEVGLPHEAVAPRALAAAIVTSLLALQERFVEERSGTAIGEFAGVEPMVRAALAALRDHG